MTPLTVTTRAVLWLVGLVVFSIGIALTIWSGWGVGSVDLAVTGVAERTGAHLRVAVLVVHVTAIGAALLLGEKLRWPTVVASLLTSLIVTSAVSHLHAVTDGPGGAAPLVCIGGITLLGVGAAAQLVAAVGPTPFEMLTEALARHTRGLTSARTIAEVTFAAVGVALGGQFGWGTVIAVTATGAIINLAHRAITATFTLLQHTARGRNTQHGDVTHSTGTQHPATHARKNTRRGPAARFRQWRFR